MRQQILATGVVLLSSLLPLKTLAATFSRMFVFGDSTSDTGNVFNASGGVLPPFPYFNGRFSNGPNWIDYLAQDLNLNPTPYTTLTLGVSPTQGINFAFGGATTGLDNTFNPNLVGLRQQIGLFANLILPGESADSDTLYVLWAGANDYLPTNSAFIPFDTPETTIGNLSFALNSLATFGARNFLVVNLPNLGSLPYTRNRQNASNLNTLTSLHNASLTATLNTFGQSLDFDLNIWQVDANSLLSAAIDNPAQFGFTNVTNACLGNLSCILGGRQVQDQYLFWDGTHPTTVAHERIGELAYAELQSEPIPEPTTVMGTLVFGALATRWRLKHKSKKASSLKGREAVD